VSSRLGVGPRPSLLLLPSPLIRAPSTIRSHPLHYLSKHTTLSLHPICISYTTTAHQDPFQTAVNRIPRSPEPCFPSWQDLRKYELEKEVEGLATLSRGYLATISALEAQLREAQAGKRMLWG